MTYDLAYLTRDYNLTNTQRVVYGVLLSLSSASAKNNLPYVYIGHKALAERVGVSPRTIYSALKRLKEVGLIMVRRVGLTKNNQTYVMSPKMTTQERENKKACCESRTAKTANHIINTQSINKTIDSKLSIPQDDKGKTAPKGKPTNKRPHSTINERRKIKQKYKEFFENSLKLNEFRSNLISTGDEIEAFEKIIILMAETMAGKGNLMINGTLLSPQQWFSVVKNITQDEIIEIIYKIHRFSNVRNPRAYLLATLYNSVIQMSLWKPWYNMA